MLIYYTGTDQGDGSLGVEFFDSPEAIYLLQEFDLEGYRGDVNFFKVEGYCDLNLYTLKYAKKYLVEYDLASQEEIDLWISENVKTS